MSERLGAPIAHDWRKFVSSQTVLECWRRDRQRSRALVRWKCWPHHPENSPILTAMRMCFEKACEQHSRNGAIDLTKERGVYNLHVQVAGGEGDVERAVNVVPNEMEVEVERGSRVSGGFRQVNP